MIIDSHIATVTFNRPKTLNSMSYQVYEELIKTFDYISVSICFKIYKIKPIHFKSKDSKS